MKAPSFHFPRLPLWIGVLVTLSVTGNVVSWFWFGLLPDEAYYWAWSQRLAGGYFDNAPLVAWLIRPFAEISGNAAWAVRLPAVFSWLVGAWVVYDLSARLFRRPGAGGVALLIWSSLPIVQGGFHIVTPDTPLVIFSALTFWFACRAMMEGQDSPRLTSRAGFWLTAGVMAGLTMLGKYNGLLVPGAIFAALFFSPQGRAVLRTPPPWLAAVLAALVVTPMLVWNYRNNWVSFAFQFHHGVIPGDFSSSKSFLLFLTGQLGTVMPWTFLGMAWLTLHPVGWPMAGGRAVRHMLVAGFWVPLLVFGAASINKTGEANWAVSAYLPGTILLSGGVGAWLEGGGKGSRFSARAGVISLAFLLTVLLVALIRFPQTLTLAGLEPPRGRTQLTNTYGWDVVKHQMEQLLARQGAPGCVVVADSFQFFGVFRSNYQTGAMVGFLLGDINRVAVTPDGRDNQFNVWQGSLPIAQDKTCLLVRPAADPIWLPETVVYKGWGVWRRAQVLELNNPDFTQRWVGFYLPDR